MTHNSQIDQILNALQVAENFDRGIPTDLVKLRHDTLSFFAHYESQNPARQALLRARLTPGHSLLPPDCVQAVRDRNPHHIRLALLALALTPDKDYRTDIIQMCCIFNCAKKLHLDTDALFQEAAAHARPQASQTILGYLKSGSKNLQDFGLFAIDGPAGYEIHVDDPWTQNQIKKANPNP